MNEQELEWIGYLIGKEKEADLCAANKQRIEQERAVREAQRIVGEPPLKPKFIIVDEE
jgi:hypothetical protein